MKRLEYLFWAKKFIIPVIKDTALTMWLCWKQRWFAIRVRWEWIEKNAR
jgi:hypothetical protein